MKKANSSRKGLSILVALAVVLSVVAIPVYAENTIAITSDATTCYNETTGKVTIEGTVTDTDSEVTIMAIRNSTEVSVSEMQGMEDSALASKIVYIDQQTANGVDFSFDFYMMAGPSGATVTVYVGAKDAAAIQPLSFSAGEPGPAIESSEASYYLDQDVIIEGQSDYAAWDTWVNDADLTVTLDDGTTETDLVKDVDYTIVGKNFNLGKLDAGTYTVEISTGGYKTSVAGSFTVAARPAGAVVEPTGSITEIDSGKVVFTLTDSTPTGWIAAMASGTVTLTKGTDAPVNATFTVEGNSLKVDVPTLGTNETATYTLNAKATYYEDAAPVEFTVVSPTKVVFDMLPTSLSAAYDNADMELATALVITKPVFVTTYGATVDYRIVDSNTDPISEVTTGVTNEETTITIARPTEDEESLSLYLEVTVSKGSFKEETKYYAVRVSKIGADGPAILEENITIIGTNVYDRDGKSLVHISQVENLDATTSKLVIGGVEFFYSANTNSYGGFYAIADTATFTKDYIIANAEADETAPSTVINFGYVVSTGDRIKNADYIEVARTAARLTGYTVDDRSDLFLITGDVGKGTNTLNGRINNADYIAVARMAARIPGEVLDVNVAD